MTITIELPEEAKSDIVKLSAASGIPFEKLCFYLLAVGVQAFETKPELLDRIKVQKFQ